ncbi:MAG: amidohydrolase family protein [Planctomycetota bacterium]
MNTETTAARAPSSSPLTVKLTDYDRRTNFDRRSWMQHCWRQSLTTVLAVTAAAPLTSWAKSATETATDAATNTASALPNDLDLIDCHTHFYDPTRPEGVPWPGKGSDLYRPVLPHHLRALKMLRPVTGTVIVEASPWVEDNAWLLNLARQDPFILGVVGNLDPFAAEFAERLQRFAQNPIFRGVRVAVNTLRQALEQNKLQGLQQLAERNLTLDVNGGPDTPQLLAQAARRLPNLTFVLNHIGNVAITAAAPPRAWQLGITAAAAQPNVFCKISALVEGAARDGRPAPKNLEFYRPYLDVVWQAFGDQRVIFGSNWPVSETAADYATLQSLALGYATQQGEPALRRFCSTNSQQAYRWKRRT